MTRSDVTAVLHEYFDGLHFSDTQRLRRVFHPQAVYATATDDPPMILNMDQYFAVVDRRPSPASRGDARTDRIESVELVGPAAAMAKVQCSIRPKHYTDLLTLIHAGGRWQIIAKVFHYEVRPCTPATGCSSGGLHRASSTHARAAYTGLVTEQQPS